MDGIEATAKIASSSAAGPRIIMLTTFDLDEHVYDALNAGASGFLLKDVTADRLFDARSCRSGRWRAPGTGGYSPSHRRVCAPAPASGAEDCATPVINPREKEVFSLIAEGLSNPEIAGRLGVSEETVKTHVSRVLAKLGLRDRTQAVVAAYESGLVVPRSRR
jgi:DNA-binding NarL/FixJ family response regulator